VARRKRGVLHVYPRGQQWWAQVPGVGRRSLDVPLDGTSHAEAYRVAAQRFGAGDLDPRAAEAGREERLTELSEAFVREHKSRWSKRHTDNVTYRAAAFIAALDTDRIDHLTAETLARYVDAQHKEGLSDATINRTIQVMRALARWAARRTPPLCDEGALARWKNLREVARNRDPLIPSPPEWSQLIRELGSPPRSTSVRADEAIERANARGVAVLVAVAVQTGLRVDELRHLRAVDVAADAVRVRASGDWRPKDREERDVPVPASVAALARELVAWREGAVGLSGKPLALGGHWIEARISAAWGRAKLPGDAPGMHDARRTFATEMSRRPGVSIRDVQRLLGHADLETTQRYLGRYRSDDARPAVDMGLAAALAPTTPAAVIPMRRKR
jgi:integrase